MMHRLLDGVQLTSRHLTVPMITSAHTGQCQCPTGSDIRTDNSSVRVTTIVTCYEVCTQYQNKRHAIIYVEHFSGIGVVSYAWKYLNSSYMIEVSFVYCTAHMYSS